MVRKVKEIIERGCEGNQLQRYFLSIPFSKFRNFDATNDSRTDLTSSNREGNIKKTKIKILFREARPDYSLFYIVKISTNFKNRFLRKRFCWKRESGVEENRERRGRGSKVIGIGSTASFRAIHPPLSTSFLPGNLIC